MSSCYVITTFVGFPLLYWIAELVLRVIFNVPSCVLSLNDVNRSGRFELSPHVEAESVSSGHE